MEKIFNIPFPKKVGEEIEKKAKKRGFASTSDYIRFLAEQDDESISTDEILQMTKRAEVEYHSGKIKKYNSLGELL